MTLSWGRMVIVSVFVTGQSLFGEYMPTVDDVMKTVTRLGNDALVAQARFALESAGIFLTPDMCKAAFCAAAHIVELAERSYDVGSLTAGEMVATQSVGSLSMQIWATLHDLTSGKDLI